MSEQNVAEDVVQVPSVEVGKWIAHINRVNFALSENINIDYDGQSVWESAKIAKDGLDWRQSSVFESSVLHELKQGISYNSVMNASGSEQSTEAANLPKAMGRIALQEGLIRVDLLRRNETEHRELVVPVGAMAALCFLRADIEEPIDRQLFERKEEIRARAEDIDARVQPRRVFAVGQTVFRFFAFRPNHEVIERLGYDPNSSLSPWWQELQRDLRRIEAAGGDFEDSADDGLPTW